MDKVLFDQLYEVVGECEEAGGMGKVLIVKSPKHETKLALKYCTEKHPQLIQRFSREVTAVKKFTGNSKIVQIIHENLSHDPPYFVMPFAENGNLLSLKDRIAEDLEFQEKLFNRMIDCVSEIHDCGQIHRDIKPQNFLVYSEDEIVLADFGLVKDLDSTTPLTATLAQGGTEEFAPPEHFQPGGFKEAANTWDIFTLGKTFYRLMSKRNARYMSDEGVHPSLYHVLEKCCRPTPSERYQGLAELKQSLKEAYDLALRRVDGESLAQALLAGIEDKLKIERKYNPGKIHDFVNVILALEEKSLFQFLKRIDANILGILVGDARFYDDVERLLKAYQCMVEAKDYPPEFSERIAHRMEIIFISEVRDELKAHALEIAIRAAAIKKRFATIENCVTMIKSINSDSLAKKVEGLLAGSSEDFIRNIEPSSCRHPVVASALAKIRRNKK